MCVNVGGCVGFGILLCVFVCGCVRMCVDVSGCVWVRVGVCGWVWTCVDARECV